MVGLGVGVLAVACFLMLAESARAESRAVTACLGCNDLVVSRPAGLATCGDGVFGETVPDSNGFVRDGAGPKRFGCDRLWFNSCSNSLSSLVGVGLVVEEGCAGLAPVGEAGTR